jgi:PKD repeat protein
VSTGAYRAGTLCDTTARFDWNAPGTDKQPTWIDYTGGDTLYSVAITGTAIYVGGHQRWMNNPFRGDAAGPGAVPREGIAALDPSNGLPFSWNPGRTRGVGAFDLTATSAGLWVGSDTDQLGGEYHARLGFFPLAGGTVVPPVRPITLPANLYRAAPATSSSGTGTVLARVNAGGDQIAPLDGGPVWAGDTDAAPSPLHNSGNNAATWTPVSGVTAAVPSSTPSQVFDSERWDPADATEMAWHIPVSSGTNVDVRLYFANRYSGTSQVGQRVFDVAIDGTTVLDHYDIVADAGDQIGTMKSFPVTSDGTVDITFTHEVENPLLNAIEIVTSSTAPPPSTTGGNLVRRSFDGTTAGAPTTVSGPTLDGIDWSRARGAFMLDGTVYTGWDDGHLYARTYDGTTFGAPRDINLYGLTSTQFPITALTGMTVTGGQMLFTVAGDTRLYSRYFTYESEIVGADRFVVSGAGDGLDWSTANGLAVVGGTTLYYGSATDGNLRRVTLNGLVPQAGTVQIVSGPSIDVIDWRTRALFFGQGPAVVNNPPTASFASSCTALACTFDGTGSSDGDGTVTGWSWNFGDGATATGATAPHTYAAPGTYNVTLTVTDNGGATASTSHPVTVTNPTTSAIAFRGSTGTSFNSNWGTVTVPANVQAGDALILVVTANSETAAPSAPAGWTTIGTVVDETMVSRAFQRVASAGDAGTSVRVDLSGTWKTSVALLAYSGTSSTSPIVAFASAAESGNTAGHATPIVNNTVDGAWLVSYWADKSSATTDWTAPAGVTARVESIGVGGGRISELAGDSGGPVGTGSQGGLVATADSTNTKATMWTLLLRPS